MIGIIGRACDFLATTPRKNNVIKTVYFAGAKKMCVPFRQMKFKRRTSVQEIVTRALGHPLQRIVAHWRRIIFLSIRRQSLPRTFRILPARRWTMQGIGQYPDPPMQLFVNLAELAAAIKLISGDAKPRQHDDEYQPIPKLQAPLDGFEDFHWETSNNRHPTSNIQ